MFEIVIKLSKWKNVCKLAAHWFQIFDQPGWESSFVRPMEALRALTAGHVAAPGNTQVSCQRCLIHVIYGTKAVGSVRTQVDEDSMPWNVNGCGAGVAHQTRPHTLFNVDSLHGFRWLSLFHGCRKCLRNTSTSLLLICKTLYRWSDMLTETSCLGRWVPHRCMVGAGFYAPCKNNMRETVPSGLC